MIERISKTALVLFSIIIAFQISLILPGQLGADYGISTIFQVLTKIEIILRFFNHKGPFVISFIDFLSLPIGYGWKQSITIFYNYFNFILTSLIFTQRYSKKTIVSFFFNYFFNIFFEVKDQMFI